MMKNVQIGCGPITWRGLPPEQALSDIAKAGYEGAMTGPREGQTTAEILDELASYGLKPAPGYLGADFWDKAQEAAILDRARAQAAFGKEAGLTELYVAAGGFNSYRNRQGQTRKDIAGNVRAEDAMTNEEFAQFAKVLNAVGEITLEQGVKSCFHNHVGSTIETREEIDRLWSLVDHNLVFMGPDTGHLAWAGADVVQFYRDYADSIKTMHIKDINPNVLAEGVPQKWHYDTFSDKGIWTELGQGTIDFPAIFQICEDAGFSGWIIVETDVTQLATPLESAIVSRQYLRSLGL
ncbi:MAG: TIM barrel protein [Caldilineaceae bacterium]|nr:TIM barrel protein [Caldilineaceae bacterium]